MATVDQIVEIVKPVAVEMVARGTRSSGLLYAGLAIGADGPAVVEFNARSAIPRPKRSWPCCAHHWGEALNAAATGTLAQLPPLEWSPGAAVTVVLAAENYREGHTGDVIAGAEGRRIRMPAPPTPTGTSSRPAVACSPSSHRVRPAGRA